MTNIIFRQIAECRSLNQIDYMIECAESARGVFSAEEAVAIEKIYASNDLDEIHLICADMLGDTEHAAALRAWLIKKAVRAKR